MVDIIGIAFSTIKFLVVLTTETALGSISLDMCSDSDVYKSLERLQFDICHSFIYVAFKFIYSSPMEGNKRIC